MVRLNVVYSATMTFLCILTITVRGDDMKTELEKLAGVWTCVSATNNGKPIAAETVKQLRLTITSKGAYKTERGDVVLFDSTCRVNASRVPKQIDLIGTEGENKGQAAQGIYAQDGEMLTICYTMPGKERPQQFESKAGSEATLVVWKRRK
jgi:uncharacterized protein (TIGR03067 family)